MAFKRVMGCSPRRHGRGWKPASPSQGEEEGAHANRLNLSQIDRRAQRAGTPVFLSSMAAHCLSLASGTSGNPP